MKMKTKVLGKSKIKKKQTLKTTAKKSKLTSKSDKAKLKPRETEIVETLFVSQIKSQDYGFLSQAPFAFITLLASEDKLVGLDFTDADLSHLESSGHAVLQETKRQLLLYFQRKLKTFDLPLDLGGTDFQMKAWQVLMKIPYGQITTYKEQAKSMKVQKGFRAVGSANGKNPIPIIIPCHRVCATPVKTGKNSPMVLLGGYSGGINIKKFLLQLEGSLKN